MKTLTWAAAVLMLFGCNSRNGAVGDGGGDGAGTFDRFLPDNTGCGLRTCQSAGATCGPIGDGCGGVIQCGSCTSPQTCGGGGAPSVCGGTNGCVPQTCESAGANCGQIGDGCGKALDCGPCGAGEKCGLGGPSKCGKGSSIDGGSSTCTKRDCTAAGANCGPVADGCGGLLECGTCTVAGQSCGGAGQPSVCGVPTPTCTKRNCTAAGANCGPVADGCGGLLDCGTCTIPGQTCGGAGQPSVCGAPPKPDGGPPCTGLCLFQVTCQAGVTTSVSGTVYAPNGQEPIYGAVVYVPNAPVQPFPPGVACNQCGGEVTGTPLVKTVTGPDGKFSLGNVPATTNVPLVIQLGRWRRQVVIPNVPSCANTAVNASLTHLPRNKSQGDIPLTAMVTGNVDTLECVLRKMGIDDAEFTNPSGTGRIHIIHENGAVINSSTPDASSVLWGTSPTLDNYDQVLFACEGGRHDKSQAARDRVLAYANKGGRVFTTHYSYVWLYRTQPWGCGDQCTTAAQTTAAWHLDQSHPDQTIHPMVDVSFPKGQAFSQWLDIVGASTAPGSNQIDVDVWRHNTDSVVGPPTSQRWLYQSQADPFPGQPQHFTFNTPVNPPTAPEQQCGRVLFSDFHVLDYRNADGQHFPNECDNDPLTAQEKVLEFMLFDLASCITPDSPVGVCTKQTCQQAGVSCGLAGDGCGGQMDCGPCPPGQTCGGGGVPSVCGAPACQAATCSSLGYNCGLAGNGCGGQIDCGPCPPGQTCGAGGPNICGGSAVCTPKSCIEQNISCGPAGDTCGNPLDCGPCPPGQTCGGGGVPNQCGTPPCIPTTCDAQHAQCGFIADGCGGVVDCGPCPPGQKCGGGGTPNQCYSLG